MSAPSFTWFTALIFARLVDVVALRDDSEPAKLHSSGPCDTVPGSVQTFVSILPLQTKMTCKCPMNKVLHCQSPTNSESPNGAAMLGEKWQPDDAAQKGCECLTRSDLLQRQMAPKIVTLDQAMQGYEDEEGYEAAQNGDESMKKAFLIRHSTDRDSLPDGLSPSAFEDLVELEFPPQLILIMRVLIQFVEEHAGEQIPHGVMSKSLAAILNDSKHFNLRMENIVTLAKVQTIARTKMLMLGRLAKNENMVTSIASSIETYAALEPTNTGLPIIANHLMEHSQVLKEWLQG